ncbi:MAG: glycosyltransferase family 2 protein [Anaerolineae bacterium]|nr:glycosyltransferase family 2 protein [Anaerolineae bacterium]
MPALVSIVIPMYNEQEAIGQVLESISAAMTESDWPFEVIVVDDGSCDDCAQVVERYDLVRLIRHTRNRGVGAARTTGMKAAAGEIIAMTDADGTYPVQDIPRLVAELERRGHDMVIGARRHERGTVRWLRSPAKLFIRWLAVYLTRQPIPDLNSGLRVFRRSVALKYLRYLPTTHSWVSTITLAMLHDNREVSWAPIDYYPRIGRSTFHPITDTYNYLTLVLRTVMYFNPLRVFLPASLLLFFLGLLKTAYDNFVLSHIRESDVIILVTAFLIGMLGMLADLIVTYHREV